MFFCVFVDAINLQCVTPNHPLMVTPEVHPESFPNTKPFGINAAMYMIQGLALVGLVISSFLFGYLSDKIGPRPAFLVLMLGSAVLSLAKYFARHSYWLFVAVSFVNGLFGGAIAVANGYVFLVFCDDRTRADVLFGRIIAVAVIGRSIGGLLTVLFPEHLFLPLIPAAILSLFAFFVAYKFVLEPKHIQHDAPNQTEEEDSDAVPDEIHMGTLLNIIFGALLDNIGSLGIVPFAVRSVMYKTFYLDFEENGLEPIMNENQYRWLYSMIAIAAVPGALVSPWLYKKIGAPISCVCANVFTACVIVVLIFIAKMNPVTKGTLALYASILYIGFPLTIISMISTGPMLDRISPLNKKGTIQGVNVAIYDTARATFPFIFALIADSKGNSYVSWVCVGIIIVGALVNLPLVFNPRLFKYTIDKDEEVTNTSTIDIKEPLLGRGV